MSKKTELPENLLFVNEDLQGRDFSNTDISGATFVQCDLRNIRLSKKFRNVLGAKFIDCTFSLYSDDSMRKLYYNGDNGSTPILNCDLFLEAFYEADYRISQRVYERLIDDSYYDQGYIDNITILTSDDLIIKNNYLPNQVYKALRIRKGNSTIAGIAILRIDDEAKKIVYGNKCRAERATVVAIQDLYGNNYSEGLSAFAPDKAVKYVVGKEVVADYWDDNPIHECGGGIHFFTTIGMAYNYAYNIIEIDSLSFGPMSEEEVQ